jgi:hypothetical protein
MTTFATAQVTENELALNALRRASEYVAGIGVVERDLREKLSVANAELEELRKYKWMYEELCK